MYVLYTYMCIMDIECMYYPVSMSKADIVVGNTYLDKHTFSKCK